MKREALLLTGIILIACVAVAGSQFKDSNQLPMLNSNSQNSNNSNFDDSNKAVNQDSSNTAVNPKNYQKSDANQDTQPQTNIKKSNSRSIASKYIEEPGAVAGEPKRIKIGGKQTDVVPVIQNGKQVGEIHIDPKTGKNVGGAGGAP